MAFVPGIDTGGGGFSGSSSAAARSNPFVRADGGASFDFSRGPTLLQMALIAAAIVLAAVIIRRG